MFSSGLWNFVSDVGKGVGRLGAAPIRSGYRALQSGYKAANFFTDISQEYVHDLTRGKLEGVKYLEELSDDEYEGAIYNIIWESVNDNLLGDGGAVDKLIGPRGAGGELIRAVPEWFLRDDLRGPVQAGAKGIDVVYRQAIQRPVGSAVTLAKMAGIKPSANPLDIAFDVVTNASDVANVLFDTSAYSKAWEISNKRTIGQAIAHGLLTADITDREQIRESEEDPLFNLISGTADLGLVFYADPTKALTPVVRAGRLALGNKGAMLHTMAQTRGRWNPIGEGGMFGPEGVVGARYKITPEEFVETPRVNTMLDVIDEHASTIDFGPEHTLGFNGPQPLTFDDTLRRMPNPDGSLPPEAAKVQTLAGRLMNDRRLSKLAGWTPDLAQALAIAPDKVTRKFVLRLAMGDVVAREAVENAMRTWVETQASGQNFATIRELQDQLLANQANKSLRTTYDSAIAGATERAIVDLMETNPANAGSLFQVAYAMGHNQMGLLPRVADDMLRADVPMDVLDAAGDATLTTAANDYALAGIFSEAPGVNRTLFSTLAEPPAIATRRNLGHAVMNVVEPRLSFGVAGRTFSPRRIIEVTREAVADHIMDFQDVDGAWRNWNAMVREAARVDNGELLRIAMKKLKIDGDADTLVGLWQTKSLSGRKQLFFDLRNELSEAYVTNFRNKIDPELLGRAADSNLTEAQYINFLLFNIKGSIRRAENSLHKKAVTARQFGTGDGVTLDGETALGASWRRNLPITPAHLQESGVIPRYAYIKNLETKNLATRGLRFANSFVDWAMAQWKKSVLLRPGWPLRVLTDEELRAFATVGFENQLAGLRNGLLDYRTELTRMRGIDTVTPAIEEITTRLQDDFDQGFIEFPEGVSNADQLSPNDIFDLAGPETISEVFEATTRRELKNSNRARRAVWGAGGLLFAGPLGALATAGLYGRTARKTMQTSAVREAAEYFGFQMREVSVRQLADEIDIIKNRVTAGRISPEQGAQEITDLRYATELLENQAATVQEVVDMLHPQMSDQYRELLTNFDRVGLMMQDAGYQGFMLGPHGAKNVFGNDPFEIKVSRDAASADNGRRSLVQVGSTQRALAATREYGAPEAYQIFDFNHPPHERDFSAQWNNTVNKQWTPSSVDDIGREEWLGDFQTFYRNMWRWNEEEMLGWLETKRGTEFSEAFGSLYVDEAGEASSSNLQKWVEATKYETDSILPDLAKGEWNSTFTPTQRAQNAFAELREKAANGDNLSWDKDVMPQLRQMQEETAGLFGQQISIYDIVSEIRKGTATNFGKISSHPGIGQSVGTAKITKRFIDAVDETMYKLGTGSVNHLSRNPLWKALYAKHGARRIQPFRNSDGTYTLTPRQHHDAMQAAKRESLKEMRDLLYELGKRTRFQEVVGNLSPFFGAYQEVISKWAGIAVRNPVFVARGTRYYQLANDEDNRVFVDLTDWFDNDVADKVMTGGIPNLGWLQPLLRNQAVTMNPGSIMIWNASPGISPGANFAVGELVIKEPGLGEFFKFFQPYGSSEASSAFKRALESAAPTILRRLPYLMEGSNKAKMVGLVAQDLIGQYIQAGEFVDADNLDSIGKEFTDEVESRVTQIMAVHAIAGATLPVSIAVTSPDYKLIEAYKKIESTFGFEKAVIWLLNNHPDYWHITRRRTKLREGVAAYSEEGSRLKERHESFANKNPKIRDFVLGEVGAEDSLNTFSYFAYQSALAEGNIERLSALETLETAMSRVGWVEYNARMAPIDQSLMERYQNGETNTMSYSGADNQLERDQRNVVINDLRSKYPYWYNDFTSSNATEVIRGVLASFTDLVNNEAENFDYRPEVPYIRDYLAERYMIQEELKRRPDSSLRDNDNLDLYNRWALMHQKWSSNATFGAVINRYFSNDFISPNTWMNTPPKDLG